MSLTSNIDNTAYVSTLNNDKVLQTASGSFTAAIGTPGVPVNTTSTIVHLWGTNVLPVMIWSIDNAAWYDAGVPLYTEGATLADRMHGTTYTDSSNIVIVARNFGAAVTFYYKVSLEAQT